MKFSIVIPCYNVQKWLRECLDSVKSQSYNDWECICVDDGSNDATPAILDEYAENDYRFKILHQPNAGVSVARNVGLKQVRGEWILFLDGDDVLSPNALKSFANVIDTYPHEDLIRFAYAQFVDGELVAKNQNHIVKAESCDVSNTILLEDFHVYLWQFLYRRKMIQDLVFTKYNRGEDRIFIAQVLCLKVKSFVKISDVCYYYRKRAGSAMTGLANVQTMKDELSHRLDLVILIDRCGKNILYAGNYWLETYVVTNYLALVEGTNQYPPEEQSVLVAWFYHELLRALKVRGYSRSAKIKLFLYNKFRTRYCRRALFGIVPYLDAFVKDIARHPINKIKRIVTRNTMRLYR